MPKKKPISTSDSLVLPLPDFDGFNTGENSLYSIISFFTLFFPPTIYTHSSCCDIKLMYHTKILCIVPFYFRYLFLFLTIVFLRLLSNLII